MLFINGLMLFINVSNAFY